MSPEPEKVSSLYSGDDYNPEGPDPDVPEAEGGEPAPRRGAREEIPEYDESYQRGYHRQLADKAVDEEFQERYQHLARRIQGLPNSLPDEETLLRMEEGKKGRLLAAIAERRQLEREVEERLPVEYRQEKALRHAQADAIVNQHVNLQAKYPDRWHKLLDLSRQLVDSVDPRTGESRLKAEDLQNPATWDFLDMVQEGREAREQRSKRNIRRMAQSSQLAGRGGSADQMTGSEENLSLGGKTPRQTLRQYLTMGMTEEMAMKTTRRLFPSWEP